MSLLVAKEIYTYGTFNPLVNRPATLALIQSMIKYGMRANWFSQVWLIRGKYSVSMNLRCFLVSTEAPLEHVIYWITPLAHVGWCNISCLFLNRPLLPTHFGEWQEKGLWSVLFTYAIRSPIRVLFEHVIYSNSRVNKAADVAAVPCCIRTSYSFSNPFNDLKGAEQSVKPGPVISINSTNT